MEKIKGQVSMQAFLITFPYHSIKISAVYLGTALSQTKSQLNCTENVQQPPGNGKGGKELPWRLLQDISLKYESSDLFSKT